MLALFTMAMEPLFLRRHIPNTIKRNIYLKNRNIVKLDLWETILSSSAVMRLLLFQLITVRRQTNKNTNQFYFSLWTEINKFTRSFNFFHILLEAVIIIQHLNHFNPIFHVFLSWYIQVDIVIACGPLEKAIFA